MMCRLYEVSRDGFNSWCRRGRSARREEDADLFIEIKKLFDKHDGCYGSPKIHRELRKQGIRVGQKRVARIMQEYGLKAVKARLYSAMRAAKVYAKASPNLIVDFKPTGPNQLWVGDVTYLKLEDGSWQYLSVIMDRYSRRIIAWSLSDRRNAALTMATLRRAVRNRGCPEGLIFHSDKGSEYIANSFRKLLGGYKIRQSMNRVREMNDNAFIESFFQDMKTERIKRRIFNTALDLRGTISEYMRYFNFERSHSSIDYVSPHEYESRLIA